MHPEYLARVMEEAGWKKEEAEKVLKDKIIVEVVTIRNRLLYPAPTLSEVIKALTDSGYHYKAIHCSFCRYASAMQKDMERAATFSAKPK